MHVIIDGLVTQYTAAGSGKTVLLLHGWGDQAAGLSVLQRALRKNYRVIAVDLPGFGGSQAPNGAWGLDEYARFVAHFLQKIDAPPFAVLGHSNGGAVAIRGLATGEVHAERLVLLASAGVRHDNQQRRQVVQAVAKIGKAATWFLPPAAKRALRKRLYTAVGSDMLVAEHMQETFKKVVRSDVQADAARLQMPTLLIYGANDDATPPPHGERLHAQIASSRLVVLPGAGHFVHLDKPTEVVQLIEEFLA